MPQFLSSSGVGMSRQGAFKVFVIIVFVAAFEAGLFWSWSKNSASSDPSCKTNKANSDHSMQDKELHQPLANHPDSFSDDQKNSFGGVQARTWNFWPQDRPLPCVPPDVTWRNLEVRRSPSHEGFLFMREMKTGSSTAVGVNLRIARNQALRSNASFEICKNRFDHTTAVKYDYEHRNKTASFLWATLRDPTKRATSQFFHFQVSREKVEPTDDNFQAYIQQPPFLQYYVWNLATKRRTAYPTVIDAANQVMNEYDFIAVTERMDESIVALQMLLGVPIGDVLYLSSKGHGGFDDGGYLGKCYYIVPPYVSDGMQAYFNSPLWRNRTYGDLFLHQAVNRSLDLTIDRVLGRQQFEINLAKFRHAQQLAHATCINNFTFPCTSGGRLVYQRSKKDCLFWDSGCGLGCLDKVAADLGID